MSFGVNFAPDLFQRKIEKILKKYDFVIIFFDNVIISGSTEQEDSDRVMCILKCFYEHGIRLNKQKFKFKVP